MNFWKCTEENYYYWPTAWGFKLLLLTTSTFQQQQSTTKNCYIKRKKKTLFNFFPIIIKTHHNATFKFIQHFNICGYRRRAPVSKSSLLWWVIIKKCFLPINYYKYYKYCESFLFAICTSMLNDIIDSISIIC